MTKYSDWRYETQLHELFDITFGAADAVNAALPEGASLKKIAPLFHNIYNNWQDTVVS